jgi:hypothetical protein
MRAIQDARTATAVRLADAQDGVVSRAQLRAAGIDRWAVAREVRARRWALHGIQTVAVHTGTLTEPALRWRAVWEVGRGAALDGVSALQAAGLTGFESPVVHVSTDHDRRLVQIPGVRVHQVRGARAADSKGVGTPTVRPGLAAVRAAQWAVSDRQAALILCMAVQQRLVRATDLAPVRWPGAHYGRTSLVRQLIRDVTDGAQSLGELDFGRLCRERGLPEPSRQVVVEGPRGRVYLDVRWDGLALVVEIDGAQHRQGLAVTADNLRRNDLLIAREVVLTIDLVGLRLCQDEFMDQVVRAVRTLS